MRILLNIGTVNATTINVGKSNTSLNVISGIINASCFTLSSTTFGGTFNTCLLDTIVPTNFSTQLHVGLNNADQVYIGDGYRNKSIWIGRGTNYNNDIRIGNSSSTITVGGTLNLTSGSFNASYFTLSSTTFGGLSNCCLLDTSVKGTLTTQFSIGQSNTEEVYIGNGGQNKKVVIGNIANTTNQINIGNASSTVTVGGPITPGYSYIEVNSPTVIPNQIGARGTFGAGGNQNTIIGDGNWRSYACYNNVPLGIYSIQLWMTHGSSTYTSNSIQQTIYMRSTPFYVLPAIATSSPSNTIENLDSTYVVQYLRSPLINFVQINANLLISGNGPEIYQPVFNSVLYINKPNIALALKATCTPQASTNSYTEMVLTRIA